MKDPSRAPRNKLLWSLLSVAIAVATVWTVVSQEQAFSLPVFAAYVAGASWPWLAVAFCAMLGSILFEGEAIRAVCRAFGHRARYRHGALYAASDIYFSAITPSATGGQPACAYFMMKDGISGVVTAIALIVNLMMYTASILALGAVVLISQPGLFSSLSPLSQALISLGYAVQGLLAVFFLLLLRRGALLHAICRWVLHILCRLRLLKREEERLQKLGGHMAEYASYARTIRAHHGAMARAFVFNLLQRASAISVPLFVFLARGGETMQAVKIWAAQCYAVLGSNTVPIPGAMGVSDYIMLDGFSKLIPTQDVIHFELLSRSLSFYTCVLLCGAVTLTGYLLRRRRGKSL